jgi:DNA repair protein SbcD/Mre11
VTLSHVTFLHAADLHLDSPFIGLKHLPTSLLAKIQESTFASFKRIIDIAINREVDFIILAGDLFDSEQRSLKAQIRFRDEMYRLHKEGIQAYVVHGNHDHLNGDWIELSWPDNVHFFSEHVEVKQYIKEDKLIANIYGFSYSQQSVTENMTTQYKKQANSGFHIGILHGTISGNKDHYQYAPFTIQDLLQKEFDYWALGHIHQRQVLKENPPIIYPGNIQGRHRNETGEKGCYIVELSESSCKYTFVETDDITWKSTNVCIDTITSMDSLIQNCYDILENQRKSNKGSMLHLILTGSGPLSTHLQDTAVMEELMEIILTDEENRNDFVWVSSYENKTTLPTNREQLLKDIHFLGDMINVIESYEGFERALAPLYGHRFARKFLPPLTHSEKEELLSDAENWLINELVNKK